MHIAIVGYGKMGRAIEVVARARGHTIAAIIDPSFANGTHIPPNGAGTLSKAHLHGAVVAIDFTHPSVIVGNITQYAELGINAVIGTTGWYEHIAEVEKVVAKKIGLLYAGNFSIGVNVFYAVAAELAQRLSAAGGFDVGVTEVHHTGKADAPSGTARELAHAILENFPSKTRITLDNAEQPVPPDALQISSARIGKTVGIHTATFDGVSDTIELTHRGKNRDGYASGAVAAAEWLENKKGLFTARDWLGF